MHQPNNALFYHFVIQQVPATEGQFYLLDMEGLSHNVTRFTKRLFYACYAAANVVIWNDKNVAGEEFKNNMKELKKEMKEVATSDRKPVFVYLKRDAGDYNFDPYGTFNEYIKKDESFRWFREMNIFSSLNAYELKRPADDPHLAKGELNFNSTPENAAMLKPLIDRIIEFTSQSTRFASNMLILKQQIKHINESSVLSVTKKMIHDNKILRLFLIAPKGDPARWQNMILVACEFYWNARILDERFNAELEKLKKESKITLDPFVLQELEDNRNEISERVKNKIRKKMRIADALAIELANALADVLNKRTSKYLEANGIRSKFFEAQKAVKDFATGNYMKYDLGKTNEEMNSLIDSN